MYSYYINNCACHYLKLLISAKFPLIDQIKFLITCVAGTGLAGRATGTREG